MPGPFLAHAVPAHGDPLPEDHHTSERGLIEERAAPLSFQKREPEKKGDLLVRAGDSSTHEVLGQAIRRIRYDIVAALPGLEKVVAAIAIAAIDDVRRSDLVSVLLEDFRDRPVTTRRLPDLTVELLG